MPNQAATARAESAPVSVISPSWKSNVPTARSASRGTICAAVVAYRSSIRPVACVARSDGAWVDPGGRRTSAIAEALTWALVAIAQEG